MVETAPSGSNLKCPQSDYERNCVGVPECHGPDVTPFRLAATCGNVAAAELLNEQPSQLERPPTDMTNG